MKKIITACMVLVFIGMGSPLFADYKEAFNQGDYRQAFNFGDCFYALNYGDYRKAFNFGDCDYNTFNHGDYRKAFNKAADQEDMKSKNDLLKEPSEKNNSAVLK